MTDQRERLREAASDCEAIVESGEWKAAHPTLRFAARALRALSEAETSAVRRPGSLTIVLGPAPRGAKPGEFVEYILRPDLDEEVPDGR